MSFPEVSRSISDYRYHLPKDRIALYPCENRDGSRLLTLDKNTGKKGHLKFGQFSTLLAPGDALVINDTKVVPARLLGKTQTGGTVEFLVVETSADGEAKSLVRGLKKLKTGQVVDFGASLQGEFVHRDGDMGVIRFNLKRDDLKSWMERHGRIPLPPYIKREDERIDRERYQTVYARHEGSCAAPTAGLHFTPELLEELESAGIKIYKICLHVGPGTFRNMTPGNFASYRLGAERTEVPQNVYEALMKIKSTGGRVVAVGTTTTRALENAAMLGSGFEGNTDLFIYPGFRFRMVDALVTNFHLPLSSLLLLVCAFAGRETVLNAYREAVERGYRFYSYGDAMFLY
ncbi:MAG: S-adenosylmethionine:tRNA ribosyltransferase-isomerase [bacterium]|nr:MAG: S-adenosylmethionine:tRNA ribosyltransferase-isomerase [bacterium]